MHRPRHHAQADFHGHGLHKLGIFGWRGTKGLRNGHFARVSTPGLTMKIQGAECALRALLLKPRADARAQKLGVLSGSSSL